jgi:hypothetical protein
MTDLYNSGVRVIIDNYLIEESKKVRDYGEFWSASSAGYCMRKLVFQRLGVPKTKEDDPRQQRVFTAGHVFHGWIQELTKSAGVSIAQELELEDDKLKIRGHFDDLIKTDNGLILYDYKTANSRSFGYKKELSHFHRMQVGTYLYMLRKGEYKDLSEGRILILEKDTLRTKEFEVHWNKELAMDVHNYWSTLNGYWANSTMPNCTCADFEGGFMAKPLYNDYYFNGEPCSLTWFKKWQDSKKEIENANK